MSYSREKLEEELSAFQASETGFIADNNNPIFFHEWGQLSVFIQSVCHKQSSIDLDENLVGTIMRIKDHLSNLAEAMDQITGKLTPEEQRKMKEDYLKTAQAKLISLMSSSDHPERVTVLTEIINTLVENELEDPLKRKDIGVITDEVTAYIAAQNTEVEKDNARLNAEFENIFSQEDQNKIDGLIDSVTTLIPHINKKPPLPSDRFKQQKANQYVVTLDLWRTVQPGLFGAYGHGSDEAKLTFSKQDGKISLQATLPKGTPEASQKKLKTIVVAMNESLNPKEGLSPSKN